MQFSCCFFQVIQVVHRAALRRDDKQVSSCSNHDESRASATGPPTAGLARYLVAVCTQSPSESTRLLATRTPVPLGNKSASKIGRAAMMSSRSQKFSHRPTRSGVDGGCGDSLGHTTVRIEIGEPSVMKSGTDAECLCKASKATTVPSECATM